VNGFVDVVPAKFGQVQNYNTLSSKIGDQTEVWNGMDFTVNARLQNGFTLNGGVSTGRTSENDCEILAALPEMQATGNRRAQQYCDRQTPWLTQYKAFGSYTVPKVNVQVSGTYRNVNGTDVNANFPTTNAYLAANSTLGRTLSGGSANTTLALLEPNSLFLDRRTELDLRFGKVLRFGRARSVISLDLFNALNTDVPISASSTYSLTNAASWLRPTGILNARMFKVSVNLDF
jgi:hypothetical protein